MNIKELLNAVKVAKKIESDYALAKELGVHSGLISAYYNGKNSPNEFACLKIAEALGKPLEEIIAAVRIEAEKDEKRRETWKAYYGRIGGIAAIEMETACTMAGRDETGRAWGSRTHDKRIKSPLLFEIEDDIELP